MKPVKTRRMVKRTSRDANREVKNNENRDNNLHDDDFEAENCVKNRTGSGS